MSVCAGEVIRGEVRPVAESICARGGGRVIFRERKERETRRRRRTEDVGIRSKHLVVKTCAFPVLVTIALKDPTPGGVLCGRRCPSHSCSLIVAITPAPFLQVKEISQVL